MKYFHLFTKSFQVYLVLVSSYIQIQLSTKNKITILGVLSFLFMHVCSHAERNNIFALKLNLSLVQFYIQKTEPQRCGMACPVSSNRSVAEVDMSFESNTVFTQLDKIASLHTVQCKSTIIQIIYSALAQELVKLVSSVNPDSEFVALHNTKIQVLTKVLGENVKLISTLELSPD